MNAYQKRKIRFKEILSVDGWRIKVYTIAKTGEFDHPVFYQNVLKQLPEWLKMQNGFDDDHEKIGFLILHAGTEGIFSLINWWVGQNMLNTHIFITKRDELNVFEKISGNGLNACIWELEIIYHENIAWTNHFLKSPSPNHTQYFKDVINKEL